jgi:predicted Zn-dependent peptidase
MREYFDERYSPGNLKLVAAGQVDFDRLVKLADRWCGNWVPHAATRNTPASDPQQKTQWICRDQATQQYAVQISGGPPATDEQRFAHRVMSVVFGDESGSRLFWALVDPGLAEFASMGTYEFQGAGIAMTYLSCPPGNLTDNLHRLRELQESIQQDGVSPEEVEIAKSKICSQVVRRAERPLSRLFSVGSNWTQRGIYRTVKDSVESYSRVTADDITATLKRYPLTEHATVRAGPLPPPEESS